MNKEKQLDEVRDLTKEATILMLIVQVHMSRHTMLRIPFSEEKRERVYMELAEMQKRLNLVDTSILKTAVSQNAFIVLKARFLMFEHEVIDFINLFQMRVFGVFKGFQRDNHNKRPLHTMFGT